MGFGKHFGRWFQNREAPSPDKDFLAALAAYEIAFNASHKFTTRGFDVHEGSSFIQRSSEFHAHRNAVLACQDRLRALAQAFQLLDSQSPLRPKAIKLIPVACRGQENALTSFRKVCLVSALIAVKGAFNARYAESTDDEASLKALGMEDLGLDAQESLKEIDSMLVDVGVSRNYVTLLSEVEKS